MKSAQKNSNTQTTKCTPLPIQLQPALEKECKILKKTRTYHKSHKNYRKLFCDPTVVKMKDKLVKLVFLSPKPNERTVKKKGAIA